DLVALAGQVGRLLLNGFLTVPQLGQRGRQSLLALAQRLVPPPLRFGEGERGLVRRVTGAVVEAHAHDRHRGGRRDRDGDLDRAEGDLIAVGGGAVRDGLVV